MADEIAKITRRLGIGFVFKASYDKANRSSMDSFRGPGLEEGLRILADVRERIGAPVLSDIHETTQAVPAGEVLDIIQIPAFLCRQTDLVVAAAQTGKAVNIKKGQFISPDDMWLIVEKVRRSSNNDENAVLITERGTFFGYGRLVNDMTSIPRMAKMAPVIFDATHSCQLPGRGDKQSGGQREMVPTLAKAGVAAGAHALFLEVHDDPGPAMSDAATVWPLDQLFDLLQTCLRIYQAR
jgi:2-dehydro-3-deoxyphosphooctonate aldolase (KDO 8-P synthase)